MSNINYDKIDYENRNQRSGLRTHPAALAAVIAGSVGTAYLISRKQSKPAGSGNSKSNQTQQGENHFLRTLTIDRPASELWAFWREEENAPRFMRHIQSVRKTGPK